MVYIKTAQPTSQLNSLQSFGPGHNVSIQNQPKHATKTACFE